MCMTYYDTYNNWGNIEYNMIKKANRSAATAIAAPPLPSPSQRLSIVCRRHVGDMSATQPDVGKFGRKCVSAATQQGKKESPTQPIICVSFWRHCLHDYWARRIPVVHGPTTRGGGGGGTHSAGRCICCGGKHNNQPDDDG